MKKKIFIISGAIVILAIIGFLVYKFAFTTESPAYRFVTVERGSIRSTVSATGTLNAVTTVSVGTQVSGQITELLIDFNDQVKKGQLLARIDPTLAQQTVTDAQANLEKARAQALQASRDYQRNKELTSEGLVAKSAYEVTQATSSVAQAGVKSAQVALDRARQNLSYTNIYAPIDGVVVARNVDKGQTVAASLSAPELFRIANDLSQMQILAQVGESDISQIKEGQVVEFTVQALQGQTFKGAVKQVRLQSTTTDNVVNYTVVVSVDNTQGKLLPGMTARLNFLTKSADNVLKVSNSALRFKPTDAELAALKAERTKSNASTSSTTTETTTTETTTATTATTATATAGSAQRGNRGPRTGSSSFGTLYYLDANGKLAMTRVKTGITDGSMTEITGKDVNEGMKVIAGTVSATQPAQTATSATPFQSGQPQGGGQRGGGRGGF
jgi:RND family efflux transporter, MFP subunit